MYHACLLHDLKYWSGYPGEYAARLEADRELRRDVAALGLKKMAFVMYIGVRLGGPGLFRREFSWGFGRY